MKVKVQLEKGETREEAEELLLKALNSQRNGGAHKEDQFPDKAMEHMADKLKRQYRKVMSDIIEDIEGVLK